MAEGQFEERVIAINRVAKVVKGGRRFSFTALVVVGDGVGQRRPRLRQGQGSARRDPEGHGGGAQERLQRAARGRHDHALRSSGVHDAARVLLKPAAPGTGVIAGGAARAILEAAGVHDVLAEVARLVERDQRVARDDQRACASCGARRRSPSCAASRPKRCRLPACCAPTASATPRRPKSPRSRDGGNAAHHPGSFDDRLQAQAARHDPRARSAPHRPHRRARPTVPRSGA